MVKQTCIYGRILMLKFFNFCYLGMPGALLGIAKGTSS